MRATIKVVFVLAAAFGATVAAHRAVTGRMPSHAIPIPGTAAVFAAVGVVALVAGW